MKQTMSYELTSSEHEEEDYYSSSSEDRDYEGASSPLPSPEDNFLIYLTSSRRSGKTTLIVNLLTREEFYRGKFDAIYVVSPTVYIDHTWDRVTRELPEENVRSSFDPEWLDKLVETNPPGRKILIVVDDCVNEGGFKNNIGRDSLTRIATKGRHYGASVIVSTQNVTGTSTSFRKNVDVLIAFKTTNMAELKLLHNDFFGFMSSAQFRQVSNYCWGESYSFIVYSKMTNFVYRKFSKLNLV